MKLLRVFMMGMGFCSFAISSVAWATPLDILKNTKETQSRVLSRKDMRRAHRNMNLSDAELAKLNTVFVRVLHELDWSNLCELDFFNRLASDMEAAGFANDADSVKAAIVIFREQNWIDDVILRPLLAFYPAWSNFDHPEKSVLNQCPTDDLLNVYASTYQQYGRKTKFKNVAASIEALRSPNDQGRADWLMMLASVGYYQAVNRSFANVYDSMRITKDHLLEAGTLTEPSDYLTSDDRRINLYQKYSGLQINLLSDLWVTYTRRMMADSVELRINFNDQTHEIYVLSPEEQDRMARKMLHKNVEELQISNLFSGLAPTVDEVITAAVETGAISAKDVKVALMVPELWDPKTPSWLKTVKLIERFGLPAMIFIPPPGNMIASLAVALVDVFFLSKYAKPQVSADDDGTSIF